MRESLVRRREELVAELESGHTMLTELEERRVDLQQTMLRISGALQLLDELLAEVEAEEGEALELSHDLTSRTA